ncbi:MAG: ABC transporter substrate-binding protein [Cyanobacteriota bacterium]|nr:ABC transporter substrate-binding protein [Cyanobacteriota bacterium]
MTQHYYRRQMIRWLGTSGAMMAAFSTQASAQTDLSKVTLRVAHYKGGWDLGLKSAKVDNFPYKVVYNEFTGGNLMIQAINAGAIDLASCSEIPPLFAAEQSAIKIIAATKNTTRGQALIVSKDSKAKTVYDLKNKKVGYVRSTTAHYFLLKMLEKVGLTFRDIEALPLNTTDGFAALTSGNIEAMATYGFTIQLAIKQGARILESAEDILSGNFMIVADPGAIKDPGKKAAIADYLCRIQSFFNWQAKNPEEWTKVYSPATGIDYDVALSELKQGLDQRKPQVLPTSDEAIASQQKVADAFYQSGVLASPVTVKALWDGSLNAEVSQCAAKA